MGELVAFVPKAELHAEENLIDFIRMCRDDLTLFNDVEGFRWSSYEWPSFNLAKLGNGNKKVTEAVYLDLAFVDFARAYYRYKQSHNPTKVKAERYALLSLEAALVSATGCGKLAGVSLRILDEAVRIAADKYSAGLAYHVGREVQNIAQFLNEKKLIAAHVNDWKSPVKRPNDRRNTGVLGQKAIDEKLPSDKAIMAMAEIFANNPKDPRAIFVSSAWALLMGTGFRIGELLDLTIDAEVEQRRDDGELRYGLRYGGQKGWGSDIRWVEQSYTDVCKTAFQRLLKLSEPGRALALHMEQRRREVYRWEGCPDVDPEQSHSRQKLGELLGGSFPKVRLRAGLSLRAIHEEAVKQLPPQFPWVEPLTDASPKMKWSQLLTCYRKNEFSKQKEAIPNELWRPDVNTLTFALGPRPGVNYHESIFESHGFSNTDGSAIKITSHQARHFLNTVAERGGMAQEEIARFFGRADMKQNRVYNHMTDGELVQRAESLNKEIKLFGADEQVRMRLPVSSVEFNALVDKIPLHATEFGFCVHDYTMSPCDKFRDCINCTEQVCVKGNEEKLARLRQRLEMEERQLKAHLRAMEEGSIGANRWFEHAEKTVARLRQLVEILESDQVADGAVIKLRDFDEHSHLGRAIAMKTSEAEQLKKQDDVQERALKLLSQYELLGGGS